MSPRQVIIVGSGPAGLTAAIYAARAGLEPLLFEGEPVSSTDLPGGQLMNTTEIENFPGFPSGLMGPDLIANMREQAVRFGAEIISRRVTRLELSARPFRIWVGETEYRAASLIISTGAKARMLPLPGIWDRVGRGVSTCATCDGFFYRGHDIAVVGGGDSALEEATFLARFAKTVTVIHRRDSLRASRAMQARAESTPNIRFRWNAEVAELHGEGKLTGVTLADTQTGTQTKLPVTGLFVAIGHTPNSNLVDGQLQLDDAGYVVTNDTRTSVPGVFACGDVQDPVYRQAITSAGGGCMAALNAQAYLAEHAALVTARA